MKLNYTNRMIKNLAKAPVSVLMLATASPLLANEGDVFKPIDQSVDSYLLEGFGAEPKGLNLFEYFSYGVEAETEYNSNLFLTNTNEDSDIVLRFGVPLEFASGGKDEIQRVALTYRPVYEAYLDNSDENNLEHYFTLSMLNTLAKTTVNTKVFASRSQGSDRFASGAIVNTQYGLDLGVEYDITGKSTLDFDFGMKYDDFDRSTLFDTEKYNARLAWLYAVGPKTNIGPYVSAERVFVESNPSQLGLALGVTGDYQLGGKTALAGYLGVEHRSFSGGGDSQTNPEFSLGVKHELTGKSDVSASVYRKVTESFADAGLAYDATGVALSFGHDLNERVNLTGAFSYENNAFFSIDGNAPTLGDFDAYVFRLGATYEIQRGFTASSTMSYMINESEDISRESNNFMLNLGLTKKF